MRSGSITARISARRFARCWSRGTTSCAVFEQAFDIFWRNPRLLEKLVASLLPTIRGRAGEEPPIPELPARIAQAMMPPRGSDLPEREDDETRLDAALTVSPREVLQQEGLRDDDRRGALPRCA